MISLGEAGRAAIGRSGIATIPLFVALLAVAPVVSSADPISTLWVSKLGNDAWSGLLENPNAQGTDGPLATLTGARDKLRLYRQAGQLITNGTIRVRIKAGTYQLSEPFVLNSVDSGTATAPVSFEAASSSARPIISGGEQLTGFTVVNGVWELSRPEFVEGAPNEWQFEQLYVNGRRATRARSPNRYAFSEAQPNPRSFYQHQPLSHDLIGCDPQEEHRVSRAPIPLVLQGRRRSDVAS